MRTDLDQELLLNHLARHLVDDIGECSVYMDDRLRHLAYSTQTSEPITPEMDSEVLNRVRRLKQARRSRAGALNSDGGGCHAPSP
jgi:hypothetical protein